MQIISISLVMQGTRSFNFMTHEHVANGQVYFELTFQISIHRKKRKKKWNDDELAF